MYKTKRAGRRWDVMFDEKLTKAIKEVAEEESLPPSVWVRYIINQHLKNIQNTKQPDGS